MKPKTKMISLNEITVPPNRMRQLRLDEVGELAKAIEAEGLLQAIVVRPRPKGGAGFLLVCGWHRLEAKRKLGHATIECRVEEFSADEARLAEIDENLVRADLTPSERAMHHAARKALYLKLYPETAKGKAGGRPRKTSDKMSEVSTKGYTKATAKKIGKATRTVERDVARAEAIDSEALADLRGTCLDMGDELDALMKMPKDEQRKLAACAKAGERVSAKVKARALRRSEREKTLAKRITALPDSRFGVVLADPPWKFKVTSEAGENLVADNYYPCQELDEIKTLDVASIAADDCVLFLWVTVPLLDKGIEVLQRWGFTYVSSLVWVKNKIGTGYWFRNQHEIILVGVKGHVVPPAAGDQWPSVIEAPVRGHSVKPDEVAEMIEAYYPNVPKIELHRRGPPRPGWSAWGNEAETDTEHQEAAE